MFADIRVLRGWVEVQPAPSVYILYQATEVTVATNYAESGDLEIFRNSVNVIWRNRCATCKRFEPPLGNQLLYGGKP